jgi:hypothetical protein
LDEYTNDLMEYADLLAAKSKGKLKKFYGYLIGTQLNPIRLRGYHPFPNGKGWFGTENIMGAFHIDIFGRALFRNSLL